MVAIVRAVIPGSSQHAGRYLATRPVNVAEGWSLRRLTPPSRLFGANGLRTGPDGRVYIAQVTGSQISALNLATGELDTVSAKGGDIIAPDDVAFDPDGNLYATEVMDGRVSMRDATGRTRVLRDDLPAANGITFHRGRLFIGECRQGGRLLELDLKGGAPRVLLENTPSPNAMEVGPDGLLYFPVMLANEIWRIDPEGGAPERVAGDLGVPDAVKFDSSGCIVSTQVHSGQVLRIDPRTGERTVLAALNPGLDNLTFVGDRLFVSNFTGEITEILSGGQSRTVLPGGLNWPLDLAVGADGNLYIADGTYFYVLLRDGDDRERGGAGRSGSPPIRPGDDRERGGAGRSGSSPIRPGSLRTAGMLFSPGYPGFMRGLAPSGPGEFVVTTSNGQIARYWPGRNESEVLAEGFDQLYGVAVSGGSGSKEAIVAAELGAGRVLLIQPGRVEVLASDLSEPVGVAIAPDGACLVSEAGAGRVVKLDGTRARPTTIADGLQRPQGILVRDGRVYIVDAGAKELIAVDLDTGTRHTIASELPVGAPAGVVAKPLLGMPPFSGPQGPFAGIAAGSDGTLYVSADADGSVLALRRES